MSALRALRRLSIVVACVLGWAGMLALPVLASAHADQRWFVHPAWMFVVQLIVVSPSLALALYLNDFHAGRDLAFWHRRRGVATR